jgi:glycerophosphoryl diester phosphodiesterase
MDPFEIVAHRGAHGEWPENSLPAFQRAIELEADAVELDVRLTSDQVLVVYHYFYLNNVASTGPIFGYTFDQLQKTRLVDRNGSEYRIPALQEVLEAIGGRIGLEIEIKGPEPDSPAILGQVLRRFDPLWESIEVTSYEPALLLDFRLHCPGIPTDLLFPRSEDWMRLDVITYLAIQRARLARARAVHLHPTQLSSAVVSAIQEQGILVHAWEVNDEGALKKVAGLNLPRLCTDRLEQALSFRQMLLS